MAFDINENNEFVKTQQGSINIDGELSDEEKIELQDALDCNCEELSDATNLRLAEFLRRDVGPHLDTSGFNPEVKNKFSMLMDAHPFEVVDLGVNVPDDLEQTLSEGGLNLSMQRAVSDIQVYITTQMKLPPDSDITQSEYEQITSNIGGQLQQRLNGMKEIVNEVIEGNSHLTLSEAKWIINDNIAHILSNFNHGYLLKIKHLLELSSPSYRESGVYRQMSVYYRNDLSRSGYTTEEREEYHDLYMKSSQGLLDRGYQFFKNTALQPIADVAQFDQAYAMIFGNRWVDIHYLPGEHENMSDELKLSLLSEEDEVIERSAMLWFMGAIAGHIAIEGGPAVLASVVPGAGTAVGAIIGNFAGAGIDIADTFSQHEVLLEILKEAGVVPDEYHMEKILIDNILAGLGLIPGITLAVKSAKLAQLMSKFKVSGAEVLGSMRTVLPTISSRKRRRLMKITTSMDLDPQILDILETLDKSLINALVDLGDNIGEDDVLKVARIHVAGIKIYPFDISHRDIFGFSDLDIDKAIALKRGGLKNDIYGLSDVISNIELDDIRKAVILHESGIRIDLHFMGELAEFTDQDINHVIRLKALGIDLGFSGYVDKTLKGLSSQDMNNIEDVIGTGLHIEVRDIDEIRGIDRESVDKFIALRSEFKNLGVNDIRSIQEYATQDVENIIALKRAGIFLDGIGIRDDEINLYIASATRGFTSGEIDNIIGLKNAGVDIDFLSLRGKNIEDIDLLLKLTEFGMDVNLHDLDRIAHLRNSLAEEYFDIYIEVISYLAASGFRTAKNDLSVGSFKMVTIGEAHKASQLVQTRVISYDTPGGNLSDLLSIFDDETLQVTGETITKYIERIHFRGLDDLHFVTAPVLNDEFVLELIRRGLGEDIFTLYKKNKDIFANVGDDLIYALDAFENSPSTELQKMGGSFIPKILEYDNPRKLVDEISDIFVRNNLPRVGKIHKIMQVLYPEGRFKDFVLSNGRNYTSPLLANLDNYDRSMFMLYRDSLRNAIYSADSNLKEYFLFLKGGSDLIRRFDVGEILTDGEKIELNLYLDKIRKLLQELNIYTDKGDSIDEYIQNILSVTGSHDFGGVIYLLSQNFLKPVGISSIDEALDIMNGVGKIVTERSLSMAHGETHLALQEGDVIHGASSRVLREVLGGGFKSGDLLGVDKIEDLVPFSHNLEEIQETRINGLITGLGVSKGYGNIKFVTRDRGQFFHSNSDNYMQGISRENRGRYERYYGGPHENQVLVRSGLPSSEIDFMIVDINDFTTSGLQKIFFELARKDMYIPVVDDNGKIVFSYSDFQKYREIFYGVNHDIETNIVGLRRDSRFHNEISGAMPRVEEFEFTQSISVGIQNQVLGILESILGIQRHSPTHRSDISRARMDDTGSTGRGTNLTKDFDFDYSLQVSGADMKRVTEIQDTIVREFVYDRIDVYDQGDGVQIRMFGVEYNGEKVDIDIFINRRPEIDNLEAHDSIRMKLEYIRDTFGEEKFREVIGNIRYAKEFFKELGVYKKGAGESGQGGLGGIGIETWILQNGGSFDVAIDSLRQEIMSSTSFTEFKDAYLILGAGDNIKSGGMENFTYNMTEEGYNKLREYFGD